MDLRYVKYSKYTKKTNTRRAMAHSENKTKQVQVQKKRVTY